MTAIQDFELAFCSLCTQASFSLNHSLFQKSQSKMTNFKKRVESFYEDSEFNKEIHELNDEIEMILSKSMFPAQSILALLFYHILDFCSFSQ